MPNLLPALPEIFILIMACVAILVDLFTPKAYRIMTFLVVQIALIGAAAISIHLYLLPTTYTFNGMYVHDRLGSLLKIIIYLVSFFSFLYARQYIKERQIYQGEYYILGLFSVLGMMVLVSANSLLVLFLGLELLYLPIYAMVAMQRGSGIAAEAAIKYFVMGGAASAILLYGISLLYGATNNILITSVAQTVSHLPADHQLIIIFALVFIVTGVVFKLGAAPFHMWVPDVYQELPLQ